MTRAHDGEAYFLTQEIFPPSSGFAKSQDDIAEPWIESCADIGCADIGCRNRDKAPEAASPSVSDRSVAALADRLRACLDTENADAALVAMIAEPDALAQLPRIPRIKWYEEDKPHSIVGLATTLMGGALIAAGRSETVRRFLRDTAALFGRTDWTDEQNFEAYCHRFPFLWVPWTIAAIAGQDWQGAVAAITSFAEEIRYRDSRPPPDLQVDSLLSHAKIGRYGPFDFDRRWVLDRQQEIIQAARYDHALEESCEFEALFVENALIAKQPRRALVFIKSLTERFARDQIADELTEVAKIKLGEREFGAVCAFAALGRFDDALVLARAIVRRSYGRNYRFFKPEKEKAWIGESLQLIVQTAEYQAFLAEIAEGPLAKDDPASNPLCAVRDGVLGGTKKRRCWLFRRLHEHAHDGDFDIAGKAAFECSPWAHARKQFETDAVPLAALFPGQRYPSGWRASEIAAFHYDVARDPAAFDLNRAIRIIAAHAPRKIRLNWQQGPKTRALAFKPFAADDGHGDAVDFTWRLLKAGLGNELFRRASNLPPPQADKVFAMLAVFDREDCRLAAARHFGLPDLPAMMALAFSERPALKAHLGMADYGHENLHWRAGVASATQAYALHLYSNYHPGADWFLQDLEHFSRGRCCQLLFFLIHHPEDDEVLATMIEKEWLPMQVGDGAYDAYGNARSFYYRPAVLNRMLHAPERLDFWLHAEWINKYCDSAKDRETRRLVGQWCKPKSDRRQK
jgi:hypothetical protein